MHDREIKLIRPVLSLVCYWHKENMKTTDNENSDRSKHILEHLQL